jgi:hypothetical protein
MNKMKLQLIVAALMALSASAFAGTSDGPSVGVGIGQYSGIGEYSQGAKLSKDIIYNRCGGYCICPQWDKDCLCDLWGWCALRPDKAQQTG